MQKDPLLQRRKDPLHLLAKCLASAYKMEARPNLLASVGRERDVGQWSPSTFLPRVI